jgi:site-specific DNA-cytosine methylase
MRYKFFQYPRGVNKGGVLNTEICPTISTSSWENNCFLIEIEECNTKENILTPTKVSTGTQHKSSSEDNLGGGISRCVKTDDSLAVMEESILIPEATAKGYAEATDGDSVNLEQPNSKTRRGRVGKQMANMLTTSCNQGVVVSEPKAVSYTRDSKGKTQNKHLNEIVNTIHSSTGSGGNTDCFVAEPQEPLNPYKDGTCRTIKAQYQQSSRANFTRQDGLGATGVVQNRYRIRKLTPRECFRLMDVDENVIDTIQAAGISNSQQYKLAGNSIVVACLEKIFEQMFFPQYTNSRTLFG